MVLIVDLPDPTGVEKAFGAVFPGVLTSNFTGVSEALAGAGGAAGQAAPGEPWALFLVVLSM